MRRTLFWLLGAGFLFVGCGGSSSAEPGADGGTSGSAGAGGGDANSCPATIPSGECGDNTNTLTCHYVDAQGCPQDVECFSQFPGAPGQPGRWTSGKPGPGGACMTPGQVCTYSVAFGDNPPTVSALECGASGKWEPKDLCPPTVPAEGASCPPGTGCSYAGNCQAVCAVPIDVWHLDGCSDGGG